MSFQWKSYDEGVDQLEQMLGATIDDVPLEDVLFHQHFLNAITRSSKKVLAYLCKGENLRELLTHILSPVQLATPSKKELPTTKPHLSSSSSDNSSDSDTSTTSSSTHSSGSEKDEKSQDTTGGEGITAAAASDQGEETKKKDGADSKKDDGVDTKKEDNDVEVVMFEEQSLDAITIGSTDYRMTSICTEVMCLAAGTLVQALHETQPHLLLRLLRFLDEPAMNHLSVTFPVRVIANFLSREPELFLPYLEAPENRFLDSCFAHLNYAAIFELFCTILNVSPEPEHRMRVKRWLVKERFVDRLLAVLTSTTSDSLYAVEFHSNASELWCEYVRSLRDSQQNVERLDDPLMDALQAKENVNQLLSQMFPAPPPPPEEGSTSPSSLGATDEWDPSIIANGMRVLNTLLDTNTVCGRPSELVELDESGGGGGPRIDLTSRPSTGFPTDPDRVVETCVVNYSSQILTALFEALESVNSADPLGDVMLECVRGLVNLVNTNHAPTHQRLLKTLRCEATSVEALLRSFLAQPTCSLFVSHLGRFISYVLYSSLPGMSPIVEHLFKPLEPPIQTVAITRFVRKAHASVDSSTKPKVKRTAVQGMMMHVAQTINKCNEARMELRQLMEGLPDKAEWEAFTRSEVHDYTESTRSETTSLHTARSSSAVIVVDEIEDQELTAADNSPSPSNVALSSPRPIEGGEEAGAEMATATPETISIEEKEMATATSETTSKEEKEMPESLVP